VCGAVLSIHQDLREGVCPRLGPSARGVELGGEEDQQQIHRFQVEKVGVGPAKSILLLKRKSLLSKKVNELPVIAAFIAITFSPLLRCTPDSASQF
jgi:hypothetical protein